MAEHSIASGPTQKDGYWEAVIKIETWVYKPPGFFAALFGMTKGEVEKISERYVEYRSQYGHVWLSKTGHRLDHELANKLLNLVSSHDLWSM